MLYKDILMKEDMDKIRREQRGEEVCWCEEEGDMCGTCASKTCWRCEEPMAECGCCKCDGACNRCREEEYRRSVL